jgi:membrane carboxypeptidase/penicillin-binding protein
VDYAVERVEAELGEDVVAAGAMHIQTSIDPLLQRVGERSVRLGMEALGAAHADAEVALVAMDASNGDILAMVGGHRYHTSQYNRAVHGRRQIGSTVKPLSWMFAYDTDKQLSPSTMVPDEAITIDIETGSWSPRNYDGEFLGEVSLHDALKHSRNIPAVHVAEVLGFEALSIRLKTLGLSAALPYPSTSLGAFDSSPLDLCSAYTVFPGRGRVVSPRVVHSVRMPDGSEGWEGGVQKWRATSPRSAFLATMDLRGVVESGTGQGVKSYAPDGWLAGKTGTTDQARDAWFVGFSGDLVVAVWVGYDKGRALGRTGAQAALPIWARFMAGSGRVEAEAPEAADGLVSLNVCSESGLVVSEQCTEVWQTWFTEGTEPGEQCDQHALHAGSEAQGIIETLRARLQGQSSDNDQATEDRPKKRGWFSRRRKD